MIKGLMTCLLAGAIAALALQQPGTADVPKKAADTPSQTYVLVVGISDYADKQIKPRPHAEADAKALYELVINKDYLGVSPKNVRLLLGKGKGKEAATRANFLDGLKWLTEEAKPNDLVLISFIGQGGPLGDSGDRRCYFLSNSTFKDRNKDAVGAEEVEDALKKLKAKHMTVFLDVNFKGITEEPSRAPPNRRSARPPTASSLAMTAPTTTCRFLAESHSWQPMGSTPRWTSRTTACSPLSFWTRSRARPTPRATRATRPTVWSRWTNWPGT